jgi:hypothetical protein
MKDQLVRSQVCRYSGPRTGLAVEDEEFFVQSSFGWANLKVKSVNAFCT